jgi:hypothetical protein
VRGDPGESQAVGERVGHQKDGVEPEVEPCPWQDPAAAGGDRVTRGYHPLPGRLSGGGIEKAAAWWGFPDVGSRGWCRNGRRRLFGLLLKSGPSMVESPFCRALYVSSDRVKHNCGH